MLSGVLFPDSLDVVYHIRLQILFMSRWCSGTVGRFIWRRGRRRDWEVGPDLDYERIWIQVQS